MDSGGLRWMCPPHLHRAHTCHSYTQYRPTASSPDWN